jgi:hypothetical protein
MKDYVICNKLRASPYGITTVLLEHTHTLIDASKEVGLEVNKEKTKYSLSD